MRIEIAIFASLLCLIFADQGAFAQEFLQPVKSDSSFLSRTGQAKVQLQQTSTSLLAPGSVSGEPIAGVPEVTTRLNSDLGPGISVRSSNNQGRAYAGTTLPAVSMAAVGINTVDCPFVGSNVEGRDGWVYIAGRMINGQVCPWVNLKETATEARGFIQQATASVILP